MRRQKRIAAKSEVYLNPHLCKVQHFGDCYKKAKKIATQPDLCFRRILPLRVEAQLRTEIVAAGNDSQVY
jgi:hypothetical protein